MHQAIDYAAINVLNKISLEKIILEVTFLDIDIESTVYLTFLVKIDRNKSTII